MTRSTKSMISSILCSTMMIVLSCPTALIVSHTSRVPSGSSSEVGSSRNNTSGFKASTDAMANRCFIPCDMEPIAT
ncbi:hypothetical protein BK127_16485 [Paenibacillus sp. FSL H7-0331]|nr:hypothetical protein BK127_16485 [Paenibacillus sp. FSL H7-0331]